MQVCTQEKHQSLESHKYQQNQGNHSSTPNSHVILKIDKARLVKVKANNTNFKANTYEQF